jgi:hypothetical protein
MYVPVKKNAFKFTRPNGNCVAFNVESLVDYMLSCGDFCDPETRLPFSDDDLIQIDLLANKARLNRPSVAAAKHNPQMFDDFK